MSRKVISTLSVVILVLFMSGCGDSSDEGSARPRSRSAEKTRESARAEQTSGGEMESEGLPRVTLIEPSFVGEGGSCEIVVRRTGSTASALTVYYRTGGTAVAGTDYVALSGSIVIPEGSEQTVLKLDTLKNPSSSSHTITFTLTPNEAYEVLSSTGTIWILDEREKGSD
jgi:hypothetical protein